MLQRSTGKGSTTYKGAGGLTLKMRQRLVGAARCAIKMHSKEPDRKKAIKLLERDLINGPLHCFGLHDNCSPDFCSTVKEKLNQSSPVLQSDDPAALQSDETDDNPVVIDDDPDSDIIGKSCTSYLQ